MAQSAVSKRSLQLMTWLASPSTPDALLRIELVETFQEKVLTPIIDLCAEHRLFLDDDY